jgi:hypothetical protein
LGAARAAFALALLWAALLAASPVNAIEVTPGQAIEHLTQARMLVVESVNLYREGRNEEAHLAARNAYLDHFEFVEVAIRKVDFGLMVDVEREFVRLRVSVEGSESLGDVDVLAASLLGGFDRIERRLTPPGVDALALAALIGFAAAFGFGTALASVVGTASRKRFAVLALPAVFVVIAAVVSLAPVDNSAIPAAMGLCALLVGSFVAFRLLARARGQGLFIATAIAVTFVFALLALAGPDLVLCSAFGAALGAATAAVVPNRQFAFGFLAAVSVAFAGNTVRALQIMDVLPTTFAVSPGMSRHASPLVGLHPAAETWLLQGIVAGTFLVGAVVLLARSKWRNAASDRIDVAKRTQAIA